MPQFRLHLEWDDEYANRDTAHADLLQIWEEIEQLSEQAVTLEVFDIIPLPAKGGGPITHPEPQSDNRIVNSLIPPFEVTHPWDEGVDIFPKDHPLHDVEYAVRHSSMQDEEKEKMQRELLEAQRALMPPLESDDWTP